MSTAENVYGQLANTPVGSIFRPPRILVADDEVVIREILARKLESMGYVCECCANGQTAVELLGSRRFDLVLADISMPEMGGSALLKEAMRVSPGIAVILVASVVDIEVAVDALKDGAYDYITKPFSLEQVSISVSRALEKRRLLLENQNYQRTLEEQVASRTRQLQEALSVLEHTYHSTLVALSKALDSRDAECDGHSLRVTVYTKALARRLQLSNADVRVIEQGVLLHDIGKIGIPDELLRRPENLMGQEWLLMRQHPEIGYRILSSIKFLRKAAQVVLHHHERYDGNGYPQGLKGDQIHLGARIFAVADALDDLTSSNSFQPAIGFEDAVREIEKMSGAQVEESEVAACEYEHLLAEGITNSICTLLGHPRYCPHNKPIPEGDCCRQARDEVKPIVVSCDQLRIGESARVAYFCTREHSRLVKLHSLGISPGISLKLIQKWPACVVQCEETEVALEPEVAKNIYVWHTPKE